MTTTKQISDNIIAQVEAQTGVTVSTLKRAWIRTIAKVFAGQYTILYKYANWQTLQQYVQTASYETTTILGVPVSPLVFWGRLVGVGDPTAATAAELNVTVTVLTQGGTLANNTQLVNSSTGVTYMTIGAVELDSDTVVALVRAVDDEDGNSGLGTTGNMDAGDELSFVNAPAAVSSSAVVALQVTTAADAETESVYRQRVLDRFQKRPEGGAYADYEAWAEGVAGIINAYPYTADLPGQVDVYVEATEASSGSEDGIPTDAQLEDVLDNINYDTNGMSYRRNASAWVNVYAITRTGFNVTVSGIDGVDNLATVKEDIETALTEYFLGLEPYIVGLDLPPRQDQITRTRVSAIVEDVVTAAGGTFTAAYVTVEGSSVLIDAYVLGAGEKSKLSSVGFS